MIDKGLHQQRGESPMAAPIRCHLPSQLPQHMAGQVRNPNVGKDRKSTVVDDPGQLARNRSAPIPARHTVEHACLPSMAWIPASRPE